MDTAWALLIWGAHIGKRVFGYRIVTADGKRLGWGTALLRYLCTYILTNKHVVQDARTLQVTFADGKPLDAALLWLNLARQVVPSEADLRQR